MLRWESHELNVRHRITEETAHQRICEMEVGQRYALIIIRNSK